MANGIINDPYVNFNFLVELDGIARAAFHECSGGNSSIDVIEHNEGGSLTSRKFPGMVKYGNIVLKRGMTDDLELYKWHQSVVQGQTVRKNGSIIFLDRASNEVARLDFTQAWPSKYDVPNLTAEGNDIAIETFELVCESLKRVL